MWLGCSQSLAQWQAGAWGGVRPVNQKKTRCFGRGFKEAEGCLESILIAYQALGSNLVESQGWLCSDLSRKLALLFSMVLASSRTAHVSSHRPWFTKTPVCAVLCCTTVDSCSGTEPALTLTVEERYPTSLQDGRQSQTEQERKRGTKRGFIVENQEPK